MTKTEILYITPVEVPSPSAASKRILNNARVLRDLGYKLSIYSGEEQNPTYQYDSITVVPS
jgi:hypothetical protein